MFKSVEMRSTKTKNALYDQMSMKNPSENMAKSAYFLVCDILISHPSGLSHFSGASPTIVGAGGHLFRGDGRGEGGREVDDGRCRGRCCGGWCSGRDGKRRGFGGHLGV